MHTTRVSRPAPSAGISPRCPPVGSAPAGGPALPPSNYSELTAAGCRDRVPAATTGHFTQRRSVRASRGRNAPGEGGKPLRARWTVTLLAASEATATSTVLLDCVVQPITLLAMPVAHAEGRAGWLCPGGAACMPCGVVQLRALARRSGGVLPRGEALTPPAWQGGYRGAPRRGRGHGTSVPAADVGLAAPGWRCVLSTSARAPVCVGGGGAVICLRRAVLP